MENRVVIGDGQTFKMLRNNLPIYDGWINTFTMTSQLAREIDDSEIAELGIEIINNYSDYDVALFQQEYRQKFSTTLAEASSLYYSYKNKAALISENNTMKNLAKLLGCESYGIGQYIRLMFEYELKKLKKMTG